MKYLVLFVLAAALPAGTPQIILSELIPGSGASMVIASAADRSGNFYLAGRTASTDLPVLHAVQAALKGPGDGFVLEISPAGKVLFATFFGGSGDESINGIAIDERGDIYITGTTTSTDLPLVHPFQSQSKNTVETGFAAKIDPVAGKVVYSTYLGGSSFDTPEAIAVNACGEAHLTGRTGSSDFPLQSPLQKYGGGYANAFATKLSADGSALVYSTFLGGSGYDWGRAIAVDGNGHAYVTGQAQSPNFPVLHAIQGALTGQQNTFLTALNPFGALIFSTYFGGEGQDIGYALAIDPNGNLAMGGSTTSVHFPLQQPTQPYIGGAPLYVSMDGGNTVTQYHGVITSLFSAIRFAPLQPSRVYALTPDGLLSSDDSGSSWTILYTETTVGALGIDPSDPNTLYLGGNRMLLKSTDGGNSFTSVGNIAFTIRGLAVDPFHPKHIFAWDSNLFESQDGGVTFTQVANVSFVNSVIFDPKNSSIAYGGTDYSFGSPNVVVAGSLIRLANGAAQVLRTSVSNMVAEAVDSAGVFYASDAVSLYKSSDGGQSFTELAKNIEHVAIDPQHSSTLYAVSTANVGYPALVKSTDAGNSFAQLPANFNGAPINSIAIDPGNSQHLLFASQVGSPDGFVARFDSSGALLSSTYFGGTGDDEIYGLAIDGAGRIAVAGLTTSYDLPVTSAVQPHYATPPFSDAFVALFTDFSTYLGGSMTDLANTVVFNESGRLLVGGYTNSPDFPLTTGPVASADIGFLWLAAPENPAARTSSVTAGRRSPGCPAGVRPPVRR